MNGNWRCITDSIDEKLREKLVGNELDYFFTQPVVRGHGQTAPSVLKINTAMKSQNIPIKTAIPNCIRTEGIPERKRGSWVGALSPWCHCPHESGGTLPLLGDAAQPLRLTPRMAGVATAHPLLQENSRKTSTEKRKKREEKEGAHNRKTSPTPLPRELERDARGLRKQTGEGWVTRRTGLLALWPSGCGTGSCLLFTDTEGSDLAGS